jgi:phosphomannomutase
MSDIVFGTDGWRGRIAEDYTFDNVRRAAQGFAEYLKRHGLAHKGVVVGYDQRFDGEYFAEAAAEVMAGNGIAVWLTAHYCPTPVFSYSAVERQCGGAINITASHNPPTDNGFKVPRPLRRGHCPRRLKEIENAIPESVAEVQRLSIHEAEAQGLVRRGDADIAYIAHIRKRIDLEKLRHAGLKLLIEPMWGNAIGWYPRLLGGGTNTIIEIHNERNPLFPEMKRPEPIRPNIDVALRRTVRNRRGTSCLINDGDADRMGNATKNGDYNRPTTGLRTAVLLPAGGARRARPHQQYHLHHLDAHKLGKLYDVRLRDRRGLQVRRAEVLGDQRADRGEESGGTAFLGNVPERDGILETSTSWTSWCARARRHPNWCKRSSRSWGGPTITPGGETQRSPPRNAPRPCGGWTRRSRRA